jgi:hypothetical protein
MTVKTSLNRTEYRVHISHGYECDTFEDVFAASREEAEILALAKQVEKGNGIGKVYAVEDVAFAEGHTFWKSKKCNCGKPATHVRGMENFFCCACYV